jgi:phosphotransferase system enzyme I (PtsP)
MFNLLRAIIHDLNHASDLQEALSLIIKHLQTALAVDVVSVYLFEKAPTPGLRLVASHGLAPVVIGRLFLPLGEGLVGLAAQRAEIIHVADAAKHPNFRFIPESQEAPYAGFLAVPILHSGQVLGVIVLQKAEAACFSPEVENLLFTLAAQLAAPIVQAKWSGNLQAKLSADADFLQGQPASGGFALAAVTVLSRQGLWAPSAAIALTPVLEQQRFQQALLASEEQLRFLQKQLQALPQDIHELFDSYLLMLNGSLVQHALEGIVQGKNAETAWYDSVEQQALVLEKLEDPYLRARADDLRALGQRLMGHLRRLQQPRPQGEMFILAGRQLDVTDLAEVPLSRLVGIIAASGSVHSHLAILARALNIPAVLSLANVPWQALHGREVLLDGFQGRVYLEPNAQIRARLHRAQAAKKRLDSQLLTTCAEANQTLDGQKVQLQINLGLVRLGFQQQQCHYDGVGLYRTETLFLLRQAFPSEQEQRTVYQDMLQSHYPRPVVARTLDIGGDKPLSYFPIEEANPFLGWRGIRVSLDHPEIFLTQVRALLQANVPLRNLQLLLPMISDHQEILQAKKLILQALGEIRQDYDAHAQLPPLGSMIEVPSAIYDLPAILPEVDFISIGSNDLTQYLLAVDRNNEKVANLYDSLHPSVLKAIAEIVKTAQAAKVPVSVCGELASDPIGALFLLGLGVNSLSMNIVALPKIKWLLRHYHYHELQNLAAQTLTCYRRRQIQEVYLPSLQAKNLQNIIQNNWFDNKDGSGATSAA